MSFEFDATDWRVVPERTFAELKVGEIIRAPSRTLTDAHAAAFQTVSCDNHPIHYDVGYAKRFGHPAPVVHGLQVLAFTAPGATLLPHNFGSIFIAFTEVGQIPGGSAFGRHAISRDRNRLADPFGGQG